MKVEKSDKGKFLEIDELMDGNDTSLTEKEYESKCRLKELVEDGYYDPYRVDQGDVAELMKSRNILSEEDAYAHNFTEEDEKRLADVLEDDWDDLDDYGKVVYHVIKQTSEFPRWLRPYPPTQEHLQSLKEFLNIDPKSVRS